MRRRSLLGVAIVLVLAVIAYVVVDRLTSSEGRRVAIIGDSITAGNAQDLVNVIGPHFKLTLRAKAGLRTDEMIGQAQEIAGMKFDQVIINLGTNDVVQNVPTAQAIGNLRRLVAIFSGARCIHIVNVNAQMKAFGAARPQATDLDNQIKALSHDTSRVDVIDWNAIVTKHGNGITIDTVHPTPAGEQLLAHAYSDALEGCRRLLH